MKQNIITKTSELPQGWEFTSIGDIALLINGRAFKPSDWSDKGLPIVRIQNLNNPNKPFNYCNFEVDEKFVIDNNQLLFSWSGTPGTSFGAFIWNRGKAILNQHIFRIEVNEKYIEKKYLQHIINFKIEQYIAKAHGSAGLAHIKKGEFEQSCIQIPPFNEQKRLVIKIENLFSKIDNTKELLEKTSKKFEQYRKSLLISAFEGRLTDRYRKKNKIISSDKLKTYLKQEFDVRFETSIDLRKHELLKIPKEWFWINVDSISKSVKNGIYKPKHFYGENGIACLRMYNIVNWKVFWTKIKRMNLSQNEIEEYQLDVNDILINRVNSKELVGKSAVIENNLEKCVFESKNFRLRLKSFMNPFFVNFWFQIFSQKYYSKNLQQTVGMASINQDQLSKMPIPTTTLEEQNEIVSKIKQNFLLIEATEKITNSMIQQLDTLRSSILKQAFEGKLVSQNPNDEPASILLERIKKEKLSKSSKPF